MGFPARDGSGRGTYTGKTVISSYVGLEPYISSYHQGVVENVPVFHLGDVLDMDGLRVDICKAIYSDLINVGIMFYMERGSASYVNDSEYGTSWLTSMSDPGSSSCP